MVRIASQIVIVAFLVAAAAAPSGLAAQMGDAVIVTESAPGAGPGGCGCGQSWQQPPWHGNVRGVPCGMDAACCRGSSVFHAHPFEQLHGRHQGCASPPSCLPRLHSLFREGYLPSPIPPAQPRCHQCGAPIEGGF